jgi:peptide-methionine (R)-S-oxide reductase
MSISCRASRLFASSDKFESGCGWPSFTKPIEPAHVTEHRDTAWHGPGRGAIASWGQPSGACLSRWSADRGGLRYCINSAALRFVHRDDMEAEGYGEYISIKWRISDD